VTFLEFCESISETPLADWQKDYILEMQKHIEAGHELVFPRGRIKNYKLELYVGFLYALYKKEVEDDKNI
jgi:hypothetical protein